MPLEPRLPSLLFEDAHRHEAAASLRLPPALQFCLASLCFICCSVSAQLPDLAPLLHPAEVSPGGHRLPSVPGLRTAAASAAACCSRLEAAYPLLSAAAVRAATTGLSAVAKGLRDVAAAAGSMPHQPQQQRQETVATLSRPGSGAEGLPAAAPPSQLLRGMTAFPALPFAALTSSALSEGTSGLPPLQTAQWLAVWLQAEACKSVAASSTQRSLSAFGAAPRSLTAFASARLLMGRLLHHVALRHLEWRRQQEIAADQTATLLQRLQGLVVDRSAAGGKARGGADEAAKELFPCSDEWDSKDQQREQQLEAETETEDSTQYTTWCQQAQGADADDSQLQQQQQLAAQQMEGLSEEDLLQLWARAVETGVAWSGSATSKDDDPEAAAVAAYRGALTVGFLKRCSWSSVAVCIQGSPLQLTLQRQAGECHVYRFVWNDP